jgi:type VI protein secretion system component VasF
MGKPSKADWDGQTRRWHDRHWFHEDADGNPVREYNTLTEKVPVWLVVAGVAALVLLYFAVDMWQSRR